MLRGYLRREEKNPVEIKNENLWDSISNLEKSSTISDNNMNLRRQFWCQLPLSLKIPACLNDVVISFRDNDSERSAQWLVLQIGSGSSKWQAKYLEVRIEKRPDLYEVVSMCIFCEWEITRYLCRRKRILPPWLANIKWFCTTKFEVMTHLSIVKWSMKMTVIVKVSLHRVCKKISVPSHPYAAIVREHYKVFSGTPHHINTNTIRPYPLAPPSIALTLQNLSSFSALYRRAFI